MSGNSAGGGNARPTREQFAHTIPIQLRWSDMDVLGHVNNVKFYTFDEQARLDYFGVIGAVESGDYKHTAGPILAKLGCDFIAQLHYPNALTVCFRIARLGRSSMETEAAMFTGDGTLVAVSRGVVVWFDYQTQKSTPIPEALRAKIRALEVTAPVEA